MRAIQIIGVAFLISLVGSPAAGDRLESLRELTNPAGSGSGEPRLSALRDGGLLLSWLESSAGGSRRFRMSILRGHKWSPPRTIAEGDSILANGADFPSVRGLPGGVLVAHWLWRNGPEAYGIRTGISKDLGRTWSVPRRLHRDGSLTEHGFVSMIPMGQGALAIWLDGHNFEHAAAKDGPGPDMTLQAAEIQHDGSVNHEQELDARVCDCCQTAAVATANGALIAYRDRSPEEVRDISLVRHDHGRWGQPYPLHADGWKIPGCPVNGPAMDSRGDQVVVAWFTAALDTPRVFAAFSRNGGVSFSDPIRIDAGRPLGRVGVALTPDGNAVATWWETVEGGDGSLMARTLSPNREVGHAIGVARISAARPSGWPQVACLGRGLYFAWTEPAKPSRVRLASASLVP